jgi:hypothetical protein
MTDGPIANYWPNVPQHAFTILREIAAERQRQAEQDEKCGFAIVVGPNEIGMVASVLCESFAPRETLIQAAALIVRRIEQMDARI